MNVIFISNLGGNEVLQKNDKKFFWRAFLLKTMMSLLFGDEATFKMSSVLKGGLFFLL